MAGCWEGVLYASDGVWIFGALEGNGGNGMIESLLASGVGDIDSKLSAFGGGIRTISRINNSKQIK
jgi:hypothetical protein